MKIPTNSEEYNLLTDLEKYEYRIILDQANNVAESLKTFAIDQESIFKLTQGVIDIMQSMLQAAKDQHEAREAARCPDCGKFHEEEGFDIIGLFSNIFGPPDVYGPDAQSPN